MTCELEQLIKTELAKDFQISFSFLFSFSLSFLSFLASFLITKEPRESPWPSRMNKNKRLP